MITVDESRVEPSAEDVGLTASMARDLGALAHALGAEQRNALLASEDAERMDLASVHLWRMLRGRSGLQLEVIQATGTESLLERFNELMRVMPLDVARAEPPSGARLHLWVLKLTRRMELPEIRLLLKLVQDFPGARVRLLLMCSREAAAHCEAADWGSRVYRCRIDRPSRTPTDLEVAPVVLLPEQPVGPPAPVQELDHADDRIPALKERVLAACGRIVRHPRLRSAMGWCGQHAQATGKTLWSRYLAVPLARRRWAIGVGSVAVSIGGGAAAWWQARGDEAAGLSPAVRRPVPEIVELLEDVRPRAVRQEGAS
jgi:hypothetical protein